MKNGLCGFNFEIGTIISISFPEAPDKAEQFIQAELN